MKKLTPEEIEATGLTPREAEVFELTREAFGQYRADTEQRFKGVESDLVALGLRTRPDGSISGISHKGPSHTEPLTLSAQLTSDQNFQAWRKGAKTPYSSFAVEITLSRKSGTISGISPSTPVFGVWGPASPVARLRDFIPTLPVTTGVAEFVQEQSFTGNSAIAPETTLKAAADSTFALVLQKVSVVATTIRLSLQTFSDAPALQLWLDRRLTSDVLLAEEKIFINGDTPNSVQGLLQVAPTFTVASPPTSDNPADIVARALGQLMGLGYRPDFVLLNPADFTALQLLKDTVGGYVFLPSGNSAPDDNGVWEGSPNLWGVPCVISVAMPSGLFLTGSLAAGAILFDREILNIQISYEDQDNFVKNLVTMRAELRSALAIPVPNAFLQGALAAPGLAAANGQQAAPAPHHLSNRK